MRELFVLWVIEKVETTLYTVRVYHQSRDAVKTLSVCPPHPDGLLSLGAVSFGGIVGEPVLSGIDDDVTFPPESGLN